jgi:hypothetical protein
MKLVERMPRVCKLSSRQSVAALKNLKYKIYFFGYYMIPTFLMCYFIVLMSSPLFYNVEHSKNKEKPWNE